MHFEQATSSLYLYFSEVLYIIAPAFARKKEKRVGGQKGTCLRHRCRLRAEKNYRYFFPLRAYGAGRVESLSMWRPLIYPRVSPFRPPEKAIYLTRMYIIYVSYASSIYSRPFLTHVHGDFTRYAHKSELRFLLIRMLLRTGNRISLLLTRISLSLSLKKVIPHLSIYFIYSHLGNLFEMTCMQARGDLTLEIYMHVRFFSPPFST